MTVLAVGVDGASPAPTASEDRGATLTEGVRVVDTPILTIGFTTPIYREK
ncbi:hypothetical protein [Micromonospora sp. NPDC023956]